MEYKIYAAAKVHGYNIYNVNGWAALFLYNVGSDSIRPLFKGNSEIYKVACENCTGIPEWRTNVHIVKTYKKEGKNL